MEPKLIDAIYVGDYKILLAYENGLRLMDFNYFHEEDMGAYEDIRQEDVFKNFRIAFNTIEWENGYDISPEALYERSKPATIKVA